MRFKQLLFAFCTCAIFSACSNDEATSQSANPIKLRAGIKSLTTRADASSSKLQGTTFNDGAKVRVSFFQNSQTYSSDLTYTVAADGSMSTTGSVPNFPASGGLTVRAVHPSTAEYTFDGNEFDFTVSTDQSNETGYCNSDFMYAYANSSTNDISLNFVHALSKLVIKLDVGSSGLTATNATDFKLQASTGARFRISNDEFTDFGLSNGPTTISLGNHTTTDGVACIIPPQSINSGTSFITFKLAGSTYTFKPITELNFENGYEYVITLTVNRAGVKMKSSDINPWESGEPISGSANV